MKNETWFYISVVIFGLCAGAVLTNMIVCDDTQAEKESHFLWICDECDSRFSNIRHRHEHKCYTEERLTAEQWALKQLTKSLSEPNFPEVWGNGDPDPNHIKYFGNGNLSRLCYMQTQTINRQGKLIRELVALNSKQHRRLGESDIELYNRVRKLEDPNGPKESKTPDKPR